MVAAARTTRDDGRGPNWSAQVGHVVEEILDRVDAVDAELVVVGLHGRSRFVEVLPGETAEAVTWQSPVPVVVVRSTLWL
jgi:nucleotide-binding universal stress UspA family protein